MRDAPDDVADEELEDHGIPSGWRQCPPQGKSLSRFIPSKVQAGGLSSCVCGALGGQMPCPRLR